MEGRKKTDKTRQRIPRVRARTHVGITHPVRGAGLPLSESSMQAATRPPTASRERTHAFTPRVPIAPSPRVFGLPPPPPPPSIELSLSITSRVRRGGDVSRVLKVLPPGLRASVRRRREFAACGFPSNRPPPPVPLFNSFTTNVACPVEEGRRGSTIAAHASGSTLLCIVPLHSCVDYDLLS